MREQKRILLTMANDSRGLGWVNRHLREGRLFSEDRLQVGFQPVQLGVEIEPPSTRHQVPKIVEPSVHHSVVGHKCCVRGGTEILQAIHGHLQIHAGVLGLKLLEANRTDATNRTDLRIAPYPLMATPSTSSPGYPVACP